ncbi:LPS export ABC transporter periplasmic protein LptC [Chitinophaga sp. SYP-B3965]|uniref:LPS export ABC transporter periplasmic protein LptC n=1 Tax=Chitinophaga sp. SYP-B3965 TaxID=2663120 RepID=UPI001299FF3F|nr:LPS export ABC transporter periplasmic protein LptC [Chitinophaga sp. SYP-B3965]MRG46779.1 LPS export ABC transporter periplasmic protein LptC [Chitinophaga sp. SYP-B3965]
MKLLLSILAIVLVFCSCENDMNAVRAFDKSKVGVEQAYDIETIMSQTAHVKGVLTSAYMERHMATPPYTEFPQGLKVVFYSDSLTITSVLTAKYGKLIDGENEMYLRDSVVFLDLKTLQRLDCKDLRWDPKKALFVTDRFCRVARPGDTIYSIGMNANQDFSAVNFFDVDGVVSPQDSMMNLE